MVVVTAEMSSFFRLFFLAGIPCDWEMVGPVLALLTTLELGGKSKWRRLGGYRQSCDATLSSQFECPVAPLWARSAISNIFAQPIEADAGSSSPGDSALAFWAVSYH